MPKVTSIEAARRAKVALQCVDDLLPGLPPRRRKLMASRILTMCGDERRGGPPVPVRTVVFTQHQAQDLIAPNLQCIAKSCPLLVFWEPISRSIRLWFGSKD